MTTDPIRYAGVEFSSGRKPFVYARLDEDLSIQSLEKWDSSEVIAALQETKNTILAVNLPGPKPGQRSSALYTDLKKKLVQAGFKPFSHKSDPKQWIETNAQDCFRALGKHRLFPRRALEGRLQRSAILYDQGLQIKDPVDMFEEITRYKLVQGILPLEGLPSAGELDALVAAYLAWMSVNRAGQILPRGEFVLPAQE